LRVALDALKTAVQHLQNYVAICGTPRGEAWMAIDFRLIVKPSFASTAAMQA